MSIKIKGVKNLQHKIRKLQDSADPNVVTMQKIGFRVRDAIIQRTLSGRDKDGKPFKGYSAAYKAKKSSRGGWWLSDSGKMLSAMTQKSSAKRVIIFFRKNKENLKAHGHVNGSSKTGLPKRDFFGLGDKEVKKIVARLKKGIRDAIR